MTLERQKKNGKTCRLLTFIEPFCPALKHGYWDIEEFSLPGKWKYRASEKSATNQAIRSGVVRRR